MQPRADTHLPNSPDNCEGKPVRDGKEGRRGGRRGGGEGARGKGKGERRGRKEEEGDDGERKSFY